nr:MFS transporter [uncultured Sphingomonas sp.]
MSATARSASPHPRWTLLAFILASSLSFVEGSVLNVALPAIRASFGAGASEVQWVVNAYLLPLSALLLLGGALGDQHGRKRLLIIGTGLFAAASLLCALAPDLTWLLVGRIAQGVGAALLLPNSLALLDATFTGEERGRAIGIWAAMPHQRERPLKRSAPTAFPLSCSVNRAVRQLPRSWRQGSPTWDNETSDHLLSHC